MRTGNLKSSDIFQGMWKSTGIGLYVCPGNTGKGPKLFPLTEFKDMVKQEVKTKTVGKSQEKEYQSLRTSSANSLNEY